MFIFLFINVIIENSKLHVYFVLYFYWTALVSNII